MQGLVWYGPAGVRPSLVLYGHFSRQGPGRRGEASLCLERCPMDSFAESPALSAARTVSALTGKVWCPMDIFGLGW